MQRDDKINSVFYKAVIAAPIAYGVQFGIFLFVMLAWPYWSRSFSLGSLLAVVNAVPDFARIKASSLGTASDRQRSFMDMFCDREESAGGQDSETLYLSVPNFTTSSSEAWLYSPPLDLKADLNGRIVILHFWTFGCINCINVAPELNELSDWYKSQNQPVTIIGIQSGKSSAEKSSESVAMSIKKLGINHPVYNDSDMSLWKAYGISMWPTYVIISPTGRKLASLSGEDQVGVVKEIVDAALIFYEKRKELDRYTPAIFLRAEEALQRNEDNLLLCPSAAAVDDASGKIFVSDTGNNRIVILDSSGKIVDTIGGPDPGLKDGAFEVCKLSRPNGVAFRPSVGKRPSCLFICDTGSHALRMADLENRTVVTITGNGRRVYNLQDGKHVESLNSPWDVHLVVEHGIECLYVSMAGLHQIWRFNCDESQWEKFSGTGEEINMNSRNSEKTGWAQPASICPVSATGDHDVQWLAVADSESNSVRMLNLRDQCSIRLVGGDPFFANNLFLSGDRDFPGIGFPVLDKMLSIVPGVRPLLQHPMGVIQSKSTPDILYIADTYNNKVKSFNLQSLEIKTVVGHENELNHPTAITYLPGSSSKLLVVDSNNCDLKIFDTETDKLCSFNIRK